ncbi:MAG: biotin synthase [Gaiellaceae bacterium]|nr:biotin synthase [Gaiellaceae bacterium]
MLSTEAIPGSRWHGLADRVLAGEPLSRADALAALEAPDTELLDLLGAAYRLRHRYYGDVVKLNFLINAKSGHCPEDCAYCSQSRVSTAQIERYQLVSKEQIVAQAERAVELRASTCCIVISARGPSQRELNGVTEAVREIKERHPGLKLCACLGLVDDAQAAALADAGVERYNHNLNTSADFYDEICSTHTHGDRVETVQTVARAGLSPCSGVIVGMGESPEQLVDACFALRDIGAESIPVNFLLPIEGTPLEDQPERLDPRYCLKVLAMFRLVCPDREIRLSAGREVHLRSLQPLGLYAANAIFASDYLTEPGQPAEEDWSMIEDLGFTIEALGAPLGPRA